MPPQLAGQPERPPPVALLAVSHTLAAQMPRRLIRENPGNPRIRPRLFGFSPRDCLDLRSIPNSLQRGQGGAGGELVRVELHGSGKRLPGVFRLIQAEVAEAGNVMRLALAGAPRRRLQPIIGGHPREPHRICSLRCPARYSQELMCR